MSVPLERRNLLKLCGAALVTEALIRPARVLAKADDDFETRLAATVEYVHPQTNWTYAELNEFLQVLPREGRVSLWRALHADLLKADDGVRASEADISASQLQTDMLWVSSNIVAYPFKDQTKLDYHGLVKWVAGDFGVESWIIDSQPTFVIERAINEKLFADLWDKLTAAQRKELLAKLDAQGEIADHAAVASLSGAGALAALTATVHFAGFAFYTTMSTVICTAAGFFGITLPFAAYTSAASLVAFLAGPWGWALLAVAAAAGVALAGRANSRKTAAAICQIHGLKVAALKGNGELDENVFVTLGNPLKRQLIGEWELLGHRETIQVQLKSDNSFTAKSLGKAAAETDERPVLWTGKGEWSLRDGKFHMRRTHVWNLVRWAANEREFFAPSPIQLHPDHAVLTIGPKMKRR